MVQANVLMRFTWAIVMLSVAPSTTAGMPGEAVYQGTCIACHGADGEGTLPGVPDLTDPNGALRKSDAELMNNITNGFRSPGSPLTMPPKGGDPTLRREDIKAVIRYLRTTFGSR